MERRGRWELDGGALPARHFRPTCRVCSHKRAVLPDPLAGGCGRKGGAFIKEMDAQSECFWGPNGLKVHCGFLQQVGAGWPTDRVTNKAEWGGGAPKLSLRTIR